MQAFLLRNARLSEVHRQREPTWDFRSKLLGVRSFQISNPHFEEPLMWKAKTQSSSTSTKHIQIVSVSNSPAAAHWPPSFPGTHRDRWQAQPRAPGCWWFQPRARSCSPGRSLQWCRGAKRSCPRKVGSLPPPPFLIFVGFIRTRCGCCVCAPWLCCLATQKSSYPQRTLL